MAWPPAAYEDAPGTKTTLTTTNGRLENLQRLQFPTAGSFVHPLSILPPFAYTYYPIPGITATSNTDSRDAVEDQAVQNTQTPSAKKSPEPTTTNSPFAPHPSQRVRPEKLQAPSGVRGNVMPNGRLLPPKGNYRLPNNGRDLQRPNALYLPSAPIKNRPTRPHPPALPTRYLPVDYEVVKVYNEKPKYKFIVDKITQIPGELFAKLLSKERLIKSHFAPKPEKIVIYRYGEPGLPQRYIPVAMPPKYSQSHGSYGEMKTTTAEPEATRPNQQPSVVVEANGDVDANAVLANGENVVILQPSARAVVGEGGTSIANPISRVLVRKNVPTTIYYRPQSVAISGPGGTSHAQSELIVDYIDE